MTVTAVLRKKEMAVLRCRNPASNLCSLIDSCSLTHSLTHPSTKQIGPTLHPCCLSFIFSSVFIYSISAASTTSTQVLPFLISSPYPANERKLDRLSDELITHALWHVYFFASFFLSFLSPSSLVIFSYFFSFSVFFPSTFSPSLLCSRLFPISMYLRSRLHLFTFSRFLFYHIQILFLGLLSFLFPISLQRQSLLITPHN